jgi:hypothetical protein
MIRYRRQRPPTRRHQICLHDDQRLRDRTNGYWVIGGVQLSHRRLKLDPLTEKDRRDLDFVALYADLVGHSFVQNATHVAAVQKELAVRRPD